jgi:hypothetical protein
MTAANTLPPIIYKVRDGRISDDSNASYDSLISCDDNPPFTDEQIDIVALALAETRTELRNNLLAETQAMVADATSEIRERVATIEGQLSALMTLLGGDSRRSFVASETIRKLKVGQ